MSNREIKFRVWDEKYKCWENDRQEFYPIHNIIKQGRIYQQYTGLKDKNGKDIYEGDLLDRKEGHFAIVKFRYGVFGYTNYLYIRPDKSKYFITDHENQNSLNGLIDFHAIPQPHYPENRHKIDYEIIGNIYENPELLK